MIPDDGDMLEEFRGNSYTVDRSSGPYGRKNYARGKTHTLDATRMLCAAVTLPGIDAMIREKSPQEDIPVYFSSATFFG